ncbi:hypothetical protein A9995_01350 [Erythrobacter sp. QSSC1-22B]|uniref:M56 family metallopeptidase n=1 Tax=Erythrobacter sp. QSSC1-22B TaxID=1860125 RepID=UPI000804F66F|nr:M56 family metallopeptidase [Erythrobacter sp. QSSC1-22B]OBX20394.1 hypothetical protein A9995_01350 [Erythrobacter sp. QSSC1-22B]
MTQYLLDSLLWTGALIALVLMLRRPVARHFGASAAYALWALPLLRLVMPPITLPGWLSRTEAAPVLSDMAGADAAPALTTLASEAAAPLAALPAPIDWLMPVLVLWLAGAMIFLVRRFTLYFAMRRELLERAKPVGEVGRVRLIETAATRGPVAFGVFDKVVALPVGFMAQRDRCRRDLAIAHELAHHRGHDLLANVLVQPLFALHWFNPLGWVGWTALRRDQEAACDARVVAARSREERAAYADIIAGFAATAGAVPRLALAAPMACPVLGDKSIIQRLRSLTMADISPRRRFAGRAGIAAALLALPLTATVSYSQVTAPSEPPAARGTPAAPEAPAAPPIPDVGVEQEFTAIEQGFREAERGLETAETEMLEIERSIETTDGQSVVNQRISWNGKNWSELTPAERKAARQHLRETRAQPAEDGELRREMEQLRRDLAENGQMRRDISIAVAEANAAAAQARAEAPRIVMACKDSTNYVTTQQNADGGTTMYVCEANAEKLALGALRTARSALATGRNLTPETRTEALRSIDEEIADLSD